MATKSKKSRPLLAWLCGVLGVHLLAVLALLVVINVNQYQIGRAADSFASDYRQTAEFDRLMAETVRNFLAFASDENAQTYAEQIRVGWTDHGLYSQYEQETGDSRRLADWYNAAYHDPNLSFSVSTGSLSWNDTEDPAFTQSASDPLYNYLFEYRNGALSASLNGQEVNLQQKRANGVSFAEALTYNDTRWAWEYPRYAQTTVLIAVSATPLPAEIGYSSEFYTCAESLRQERSACLTALAGGVVLLIALVIMLLYAVRRRKEGALFAQKVARALGHIWLEARLAVLALLIIVCALLLSGPWPLAIPLIAWGSYFIYLEIRYNPRGYQNSLTDKLRKKYRQFRIEQPFRGNMLVTRFWVFLATELLLSLLALFLVSYFGNQFYNRGMQAFTWLMGAAFAALAVLAAVCFVRGLRRFGNDVATLTARIAAARAGNLTAAQPLPEASDLYQASVDLEKIRTGISSAVEEQVRSERMKIDLITNVSHDLKTPLTSIISYVDLLAKENLPQKAQEYVGVLAHKSDRLKRMVQDIFDLSKATSGNLELHMAVLDYGKLVRQTLADMEEAVEQSGLVIRSFMPEEAVLIYADGDRLYRVFQNLIKNALQYSLKGTRIYIEMAQAGGEAAVSVKNTANYELGRSAHDLTERFVRGDQARSQEGSGLGLSIAKSYTEACGGSFFITADADLFSVRVAFPLVEKEEETDAEGEGGGTELPLCTTD